MSESLAPNTINQYNSPLKIWWQFYAKKGLNSYEGEEKDVLEFLSNTFTDGAAYGTWNTARSAINLILSNDLKEGKYLNRFFKGVFKLRPTTPKYSKNGT